MAPVLHHLDMHILRISCSNHMKILNALIFFAAIYTSTAAQSEEELKIFAQNNQISFESPNKGEWKKVFFSSKNHKIQLFNGKNFYFEKGSGKDLSKDGEYLLINKIERGIVSENSHNEEYEKYYCSFVDMQTGCVVLEETGYFCGGNWSDRNGYWSLDGESIPIDIRLNKNLTPEAIKDFFKSTSDDANYQVCTSRIY